MLWFHTSASIPRAKVLGHLFFLYEHAEKFMTELCGPSVWGPLPSMDPEGNLWDTNRALAF